MRRVDEDSIALLSNIEDHALWQNYTPLQAALVFLFAAGEGTCGQIASRAQCIGAAGVSAQTVLSGVSSLCLDWIVMRLEYQAPKVGGRVFVLTPRGKMLLRMRRREMERLAMQYVKETLRKAFEGA